MEVFFAGEEGELLQEEIAELLDKLIGQSGESGSNITQQPLNLKDRIQVKEVHLKELINLAKDKLKSNSKFSDAKQREREEKLNLFFNNFSAIPEEFIKSLEKIKLGLSKKLIPEEINNLCQTKIKLNELQMELDNLQQNQQHPQILQPTNPPFGALGTNK